MSSFGPHLIAGITVGTFASGILSIHQYPDCTALTMLPFIGGVCGALTPDMDIKSHSSMFMYLLYVIGAVYLFIGIFAATYYNFNNFALCLAIASGYFFGFLTHILLDEA